MSAVAQSQNPVQLGQILGRRAGQYADLAVTQLSQDSRTVVPGALFVALPGHVHDGRRFIGQAVDQGAVAVLAEAPVEDFIGTCPVPVFEINGLSQRLGDISAEFYARPSAAMGLVGVTGTNGKTTVSRLIGQLGRGVGRATGVIGTLGAALDDGVDEAPNTTPDPISIQRQLADWREKNVELVAMEVSSHALDQGRVNGVEFNVAVLTNLSRDHLDYHGDMASYGSAKARLFDTPSLEWAVINIDDPFARSLKPDLPAQLQVLAYSASGDIEADVRVRAIEFSPAGFRAQLSSPWGERTVACPLPGSFNVDNLLAALCASVSAGCDWRALLEVIPSLHPVPGRMQLLTGAGGQQVVVDYAHTPDALGRVLASLRNQVTGKLLCVFGCGGDRDSGKRVEMGRVACELADEVIVTSDNPRSESPARIIAEVLEGCTGSFLAVEDRAQAIRTAVTIAGAGDCVLIAGKGHENYQLIGDKRFDFSDVEQARVALELDKGVVQ